MEALRTPRYRLVLGASTLSGIALWLSNIAVVAGMLQTGRPVIEIGLFQGVWTLGVPFAVILGGLLTDRLGPTAVLIVGLAVEAAGLGLMALAFGGGWATLPALLVMALLIGGSDGFSGVALNVLAGGVVQPRAMGSAIGLLLIAVAAGRIVGGTMAGPLVDWLGTAWALAACAALVAVAALVAASIGRVRLAVHEVGAAYLDLRPGLRWYRAQPDAVTVLALGGLMALLVYGYFSLLPIVVGQALGTETQTLGLAMAIGGVGVAVAAVAMGRVSRRLGLGRLLLGAVLGAGAGVAALSVSHTGPVIVAVAIVLPVFTNVQGATSSLILQGLAPPGIRGRVMGLYALVFAALLPVGTIAAGWLGDRFGVRETLAVLGVAMAVAAIALLAARPGLLRLAAATVVPVADEVVVGLEPGAR